MTIHQSGRSRHRDQSANLDQPSLPTDHLQWQLPHRNTSPFPSEFFANERSAPCGPFMGPTATREMQSSQGNSSGVIGPLPIGDLAKSTSILNCLKLMVARAHMRG